MPHIVLAAARAVLAQPHPVPGANAYRLELPGQAEVRGVASSLVLCEALRAELPFAHDGQTVLRNHVAPRQKRQPVETGNAGQGRKRA